MTNYEFIELSITNHVALVKLNRPEIMNALNWQMYSELEDSFLSIQKDPDVRSVVLTGQGRAFCSGDDVKEIMVAGGGSDRLQRIRPGTTPAAKAILDCDRPIVAAVNGPAVGWGMDLSLMADFRIASERASFGELFVKRGLVADVGGLVRLPKIVGPQRAAELLFTGEVISAGRALGIGLVMEVVPHDKLLSSANALANKIAEIKDSNVPVSSQEKLLSSLISCNLSLLIYILFKSEISNSPLLLGWINFTLFIISLV